MPNQYKFYSLFISFAFLFYSVAINISLLMQYNLNLTFYACLTDDVSYTKSLVVWYTQVEKLESHNRTEGSNSVSYFTKTMAFGLRQIRFIRYISNSRLILFGSHIRLYKKLRNMESTIYSARLNSFTLISLIPLIVNYISHCFYIGLKKHCEDQCWGH